MVTCSPDVASSTNLGGWINKTGVWSVAERRDWFADDTERLLRWSERANGQHIELGIAEVNLVSLLGELGATWSRWGERLIPIATIYDPFVSRALEPWSYGIYSGGQSILVGTPSGVTLAPEGGAHQSITTPSIGLEQPGCTAWEPAFAQDLEWCFLAAMESVGVPGGTSSYFRLSTRPLDPALAAAARRPGAGGAPPSPGGGRRLPAARGARARTRSRSRWSASARSCPRCSPRPRRLLAAGRARRGGLPDQPRPGLPLVPAARAPRRRHGWRHPRRSCSPRSAPAPLVTVLDGHPHTLSFLAGARGDRIRCLGVEEFGQSSGLDDAYRLHGLDAAAVVDAALGLV